MKNSILFICLLFVALTARAQTIDSILTAPQTIELSISTPQPRLNETFEIRLDATHIRANIFKSLINNFDFPLEIADSDDNILTMKVRALAKGKNEIGPFEFYLDKTRYTSNKVSYEVVDALPHTDNGIWFRKVMTGANTFCIIIEQRIPAATKSRKTADNSITITTEPVSEEMVEFKDSYSIDGVSGGGSQRNTSFSNLMMNGEDVPFKYGYAIYYFTIDDDKAKIKITRDKFKNLPKDYKFEEIVVQ
jgi:hypothetical protein